MLNSRAHADLHLGSEAVQSVGSMSVKARVGARKARVTIVLPTAEHEDEETVTPRSEPKSPALPQSEPVESGEANWASVGSGASPHSRLNTCSSSLVPVGGCSTTSTAPWRAVCDSTST
jgi:hypothetical protein